MPYSPGFDTRACAQSLLAFVQSPLGFQSDVTVVGGCVES